MGQVYLVFLLSSCSWLLAEATRPACMGCAAAAGRRLLNQERFSHRSAVPCKLQHAAASTWECAGTTADRRSCLFTNVFFNAKEEVFYVAGINRDVATQVEEQHVIQVNNYNVRLRQDHPPENATTDFCGFTPFWWFPLAHGASYSFGHALVHELFPK